MAAGSSEVAGNQLFTGNTVTRLMNSEVDGFLLSLHFFPRPALFAQNDLTDDSIEFSQP